MKEQEVRELVEYVRGEGPPLVITGSRGCGKTDLMKKLRESLEKANLVCAEVSAEEGPRDAMDEGLARAAEERMGRVLRGHGVGHRFLHSRNEHGGPALPAVSLESGKLVLFIDGLDFVISHASFNASFLPLEIPSSMRLIVAVSRGPIVEALAARGWRIHEVRPLEICERRASIRTWMERDEAQEKALLAWQSSGHPQSLRIAISTTKETGQALSPNESVQSVTARLLACRAPKAEYIAFMAVAEYGLPPHAIGEKVDRLAVSWLEPLVVLRRGFFVPTTSEGAEAFRGFCSEEQLRAAHRRVFEIYSDGGRLSFHREAAEHLLAIQEYELLAEHLTKFEVFQSLVNNSQDFLEECWQNLHLRDWPERHERMVAETLPRLEIEARVALLNNVGLLARRLGWVTMAEKYLRQALAEARNAFPPTHAKVGTALINLAERLQRDPANDQEVEGLYREVLATLEGPLPVDEGFQKPWLVLDSYAKFLEGRQPRREDEGLALRERAIEAARAELGPRHPQVGNELLYAGREIRWYAPARALAMAQQAHDIMLAATGPLSASTLFAQRQIGAAELVLGRIQQSNQTIGRALEIARAHTLRCPFEVGYALEQMISNAEACDDRPAALRWWQEQLEHYRAHPGFGPGNAKTILAGWELRDRYEAESMFEKALEMDEWLGERYGARGGAECSDALKTHVASARVLWRMGRRGEGEARIERWNQAIAASPNLLVRRQVAWLRSAWAREDGRAVDARTFLEQVLANALDSEPSAKGWAYLMAAVQSFLDGDFEVSERQHEAGAGLVKDWQRHLREFALAPYQPRASDDAATAEVRRSRRAELDVRFALSPARPYLDRRRLPVQVVRAAWNPADGRTLAVLDESGQTYLFAWHVESAHLERLDQPFTKRDLPKDLATVTLRWSASGSALRFLTPDADQTLGTPAKDDVWVPANTLSPDGRCVAFLGNRSISVMKAFGHEL